MAAAKIKCPGCGAKNEANTRRCRVCAGLINLNVPEPGKSGESDLNAMPEQTYFDANDINQQLRPKADMFKGGGGSLAARIAAAKGGGPATPPPSQAPDNWPTPAAPAADEWSSGPSFETSSYAPSAPETSFGPSSSETFTPMDFGPPSTPAPAPVQPDFGPQAFSPAAFNPQEFTRDESFAAPDLGGDETFVPQEFNVAKPDLPPLEVEDDHFDPNALFRDTPGAF